MLTVFNVRKDYGGFTALEEINLEFSNGVYGLLAPNGAGKTTLIKMLTTLIIPTKGEILFEGKNIIDMDEQYRDIIGYLPQDFGYYKNYSPNQYLMYLAALKGIDSKIAKKKIAELLKLVALEDVATKKMRKFSGGMRQRVGIAQAMLNNPKVLILDEPTAGLDPKERARFRSLLSQLGRDRIIILSTHIVSDVESIAKEIIMIKDKKITYQASVEEIGRILYGRVYETMVSHDELEKFQQAFHVLSERQESRMMKVRFIATENIKSEWTPVIANLEDVFLYEYQDVVGS